MSPDEETNWEDYESGPFCAHWSDLGDCSLKCLRESCKHPCNEHYSSYDDSKCKADGCTCAAIMYERDGKITDEA